MQKKFSAFLSLLLCLSLLLSLAACQRTAETEPETAQASFDAFTLSVFQEEVSSDLISLHYSLKEPENYGISQYPCTFGTYSAEEIEKSQETLALWKKELEGFPYEDLTEEQKRTYDVLAWTIENEQKAEGLSLYSEALGPVTGVQSQLPVLLAEYPFYDKGDIEDYLSLLSTADDYFTQIIAFEQEKSQAGLFMSDRVADEIISACQAFCENPEENYLLSTFEERISEMEELTEQEREAYSEENRQVVLNDFLPAYEILIDGLTGLKGTGQNEKGLSAFPEGKKYCQYLLSSYTGTDRTPEEYEELLLTYINDSLSAMSELLRNNPNLIEQTASFRFGLTEPEQILSDLQTKMTADFPALPVDASYTIKYVPEELEESLSPAFYLIPPLDASLDNVIYINGGSTQPDSLYSTLAHEGYPGHLYQTVYSASCISDPLRYVLSFPGYSEGWATYVEEQAFLWDSSVSEPLAKVMAYNDSVSLGLTALLDLYINYFDFSLEDTTLFLDNYFGVSDTESVEDIYYYIVAEPCNYLKYYGGYVEFRELRKTAEETLKDQFSAKEFHQFLLEAGEAPFPVLEKWMEEWMESCLHSK